MLPTTIDPGSHAVTLAIATGPIFASLIGSSLTISPPLLTPGGTNAVTITLNDGYAAVVSYSFNIIVINLPPVFLTALVGSFLGAATS